MELNLKGTPSKREAPSIKTAQTAARLMRLRQEMTGKASDANTLVQKTLSGATAKAMQGVTVHTAGTLGHAVSLAAFGQNPADTAAMDAVMDAIGSVKNANRADAKEKLAYQSNQKALTAAQVKLDDLQQQTMASVQAQVKQEIA